jgi:hypothetical protein
MAKLLFNVDGRSARDQPDCKNLATSLKQQGYLLSAQRRRFQREKFEK